MPSNVSADRAQGLSLVALGAVLRWRACKIVDLVLPNHSR